MRLRPSSGLAARVPQAQRGRRNTVNSFLPRKRRRVVLSLRPLFWRLEVSEQPWERLRRGRRAGGCRTHQRVFVTFQSLQSQSRGGGWSGGAPHLPRLASLAGHLHAIATRGDTGESRRDLEPPRGANKQHARARRLVRAAARRVGGGCVGPCLDEQRDHLPRRRERVRVSPG